MTDFLMSQLFGFNGLVKLSNLVFLLAFSVHDVLKLRILSVFSFVVILPYYYFQQQTLWRPPLIRPRFKHICAPYRNIPRILSVGPGTWETG
jgi:hypothetical protein